MNDYLLTKVRRRGERSKIIHYYVLIGTFLNGVVILYLLRHVSVFDARVEQLEVAGEKIPSRKVMCTEKEVQYDKYSTKTHFF